MDPLILFALIFVTSLLSHVWGYRRGYTRGRTVERRQSEDLRMTLQGKR